MSPYDHPTYFAFIDRIRENPDDDVVRLICADWLEGEMGEAEEAGLIRTMVEEKLKANMRTLGVLGDPTNDKCVTKYVRGFVEEIHLPAADWVKHAAEILKRNPIRKVALTDDWRPYVDATPWEAEWPGIEFTFERRGIYSRDESIQRTIGELGGMTNADVARELRDYVHRVHNAHP